MHFVSYFAWFLKNKNIKICPIFLDSLQRDINFFFLNLIIRNWYQMLLTSNIIHLSFNALDKNEVLHILAAPIHIALKFS